MPVTSCATARAPAVAGIRDAPMARFVLAIARRLSVEPRARRRYSCRNNSGTGAVWRRRTTNGMTNA